MSLFSILFGDGVKRLILLNPFAMHAKNFQGEGDNILFSIVLKFGRVPVGFLWGNLLRSLFMSP